MPSLTGRPDFGTPERNDWIRFMEDDVTIGATGPAGPAGTAEAVPYGAATTSDDLTYSVTTTPVKTTFLVGDRIVVKMPSDNGGGMSLVVNGLSSVVVAKDRWAGGLVSMAASDLRNTVEYEFCYLDTAGTKYWRPTSKPISALDLPTGIDAIYLSSGVVTNTKLDYLQTATHNIEAPTILTKTANYSQVYTDTYIQCSHATTPFTITLLAPGSSGIAARSCTVKNKGAANVTVVAASTTIDGNASIVLTTNQSITVCCAGAEWDITSKV